MNTGSPKVPTPITDKNGKQTTVHKKVDGASASTDRLKKLAVPTAPTTKVREPLIDTNRIHVDTGSRGFRFYDDDDEDGDNYVSYDRVPGAHATYGGYNWGVTYSDSWNDWQVNHGYFGSSSVEGQDIYIDGSKVPLADTDVIWTADTKTGADAAVLWQYRDEINAALIEKGYGGTKKVRIRAKITDDEIALSEYDFSRWDDVVIPRD